METPREGELMAFPTKPDVPFILRSGSTGSLPVCVFDGPMMKEIQEEEQADAGTDIS